MPPTFTMFVRSVAGAAVPRYDTGSRTTAMQLIGATRISPTEIEWDTEKVTPLTSDYCSTFSKELRRHLKAGELVEATEAEYNAWISAQESE